MTKDKQPENNPTAPHEDEENERGGFAFSLDRFYRLNRRILIWLSLFVLIWLMRDFFGLVFLTYVLAFIAAPMAVFCQRHLRMSRRISIFLVFGLFLLALLSFGRYIVPQVANEANTLIQNLPKTEERLIDLKDQLVGRYPTIGPILMDYLRNSLPEEVIEQTRLQAQDQVDQSLDKGVLSTQEIVSLRSADDDELVIKLVIRQKLDKIREKAPFLLSLLWTASGTAALAWLFSFLISLDIARLGQEVQNLRYSRLRDFYEETAQPVVRFAYVVGRAIQAQAMIAMTNTVLTFFGMLALGVPSLAMLSVIVFLCSFIPVLGVFISTVPIVLVGLNASGVVTAMLVIVMIILIHMIEAYLLNPLIYGKHLKINPVLVLIILFIGHHVFGVWGMLLGVPVAHYFIHDVFGVPVWAEKRMAPAHPADSKSLAQMPRNHHDVGLLPPEQEQGARISDKG